MGREVLTYILTGMAIPAIMSVFLDLSSIQIAAMCLPLIALVHELMHLLAIRLLGLEYRFEVSGLKVGFIVRFSKPSHYIVAALLPQAITVSMLVLGFAGMSFCTALAVMHLAISCEDIVKSVKYAIRSCTR